MTNKERVALISLILLFLFIFCLSFFPIQSDDLFIYITVGKYFFSTWTFPLQDPYILFRGTTEWNLLHEWGAFLFFDLIYEVGGWTGLILTKTLILLLVSALPFVVAGSLRKVNLVLVAFVAAAFFGASSRFIERSSLFSDTLTALIVALILLAKRSKNQRKHFFIFPFVFLLWTNIHPGFLIGLTVVGFWVISEICKRCFQKESLFTKSLFLSLPFVSLILSTAVCFVNPRGIYGVIFPLRPIFEKSFEMYRRHNYEWWKPLNPVYLYYPDVKFYFLAICISIFVCVLVVFLKLREKKFAEIPFFEIFSTALFVYLGFNAIRFVTTTSFSLSVLMSSLLLNFKEKKKSRYGNFLSYVLMVTLAITSGKILFFGYSIASGPRKFGTGLDENVLPIKGAEFLDKVNPNINIFNQHEFGGYMIWKWNGARKVFYHGFVDDLDFYRDNYLSINYSFQDFERIVNKFDIKGFFLRSYPVSLNHVPNFYQQLISDPRWHLVYHDSVAMLFLKDVPENKEVISAYSIKKEMN